MKKLLIYEYQAKEIKDALRMASNALNSETKETCTDRTIIRAKGFIDQVLIPDVLKEKQPNKDKSSLFVKEGKEYGVTAATWKRIEKFILGLRDRPKDIPGYSEEFIKSQKQKEGIDLVKLQSKLDDMFEKETPESFNKWLEEKRSKEDTCTCSQGRGIDHDEHGNQYCIDCGKYTKEQPNTVEEFNSFQYLKCEYKQQIKRMEKIGINVDAQLFEQCVNTLLVMVEQKQYFDAVSKNKSNQSLDELENWAAAFGTHAAIYAPDLVKRIQQLKNK